MRSILRLFILLLKRQVSKPLFLALITTFPLICAGISLHLSETTDSRIHVLLATDAEDSFTRSVIHALEKQDDRIFYESVDTAEMKHLLSSGSADCGYYFHEDLLQKLLQGEYHNTVTLYIPDDSEFYMFTNEVVHAAIFHQLSPLYAEHFITTQEQYGDVAELAEKEIPQNYRKLYRAYENSGIQFSTVEGNIPKGDSLLSPVQGICGLLLSGVVLFAGADFQRKKEEGKLKALPLQLKRAYFPCLLLASYLPVACSCLAAMTLCRSDTLTANIISLLWYFPVLLVFSGLLVLLTRKHAVQMSFLPCYLFAELVLCPIFWNLASIFEIIRILEKFFPVHYFL